MKELYCGVLFQKVMKWYVFRNSLDSCTVVHKFKQLLVPVVSLTLLLRQYLSFRYAPEFLVAEELNPTR